MNLTLKIKSALAVTAFLFVQCTSDKVNPPNVLLLIADDLGFSDLGCYGGEIATPNLDKLASKGLRYTQFSNCARCWPSRSALLSGYYPQQIGRDRAPGISGGAMGKRPDWARLVTVYLKDAGYRSYHSGKWHIDGKPTENGFDHSYYISDLGRYFSPTTHYKDDQKLPPVKRDSGYYNTVAIADHAIECLKEHKANHAKQPFFAYVAFAAPHFPLQALPEDIEAVGNRYAEGWEKLRGKRWERIKELGIANGVLSKVEPQIGPPYHFPEALEILGEGEVNRLLPWDSLTPGQKQFQVNKMNIHAAMVERMDKEIGRIINQVKEMGAFENTLIVFLSDNGASAEIMVRDDGHDPNAAPGSAATHLCLGPGWSNMCNTPFRRHKTWVHEGGSCTPFIAHWPKGIRARGELRQTVGHVVDFVPTLLDLAGISVDKTASVPYPGQTLKPSFKSDMGHQNPLWYYHEGHRALRTGNWKIVAAKDEPWELFNLSADRTESDNLAGSNPEKVVEMENQWKKMLEEFRQVTPQKSEETQKLSVTTKNLE